MTLRTTLARLARRDPDRPTIRERLAAGKARLTRLTRRPETAAGLTSAARNIGRARRWSRALLDRAGHEAGRGNVLTAAALLVLYVSGL